MLSLCKAGWCVAVLDRAVWVGDDVTVERVGKLLRIVRAKPKPRVDWASAYWLAGDELFGDGAAMVNVANAIAVGGSYYTYSKMLSVRVVDLDQWPSAPSPSDGRLKFGRLAVLLWNPSSMRAYAGLTYFKALVLADRIMSICRAGVV